MRRPCTARIARARAFCRGIASLDTRLPREELIQSRLRPSPCRALRAESLVTSRSANDFSTKKPRVDLKLGFRLKLDL